jgi:hypothetical protein
MNANVGASFAPRPSTSERTSLNISSNEPFMTCHFTFSGRSPSSSISSTSRAARFSSCSMKK